MRSAAASLRPTEIRFLLPPEHLAADLARAAGAAVTSEKRAGCSLRTRETVPVDRADHVVGARARDLELGHFSVTQPSLERTSTSRSPAPMRRAARRWRSNEHATRAPGGSPLRRGPHTRGLAVVYEQRAFWRNRARAFFSFLMPIMFLVILRRSTTARRSPARTARFPTTPFFIPGILAYGIIATTFVNMALSTAILREQGVLKRMAGTPLPGWAYLAGRIGSTLVTTAR